jgi:cell migration-inducing and hyaluronan-binding protein
MPRENPAYPDSKRLETHFENLITYKNRNGGFWGRGELFVVRNLKTADNAIGYTMSTGSIGDDLFTSLVVDSLFVGETENIGNPTTKEEIAYGRSLPKRLIPDFPIRGYEYYDYRVDVANTTFVNFQDNNRRGSGALSWLLFTSSGVTTENTIKGAKYTNAKPVYFPKIDPRFDNDNRGGSAYRTLAIHDLDGSTTGIPNSYVLLNDGENDSVATDNTCKIQPTWNASVCTGDSSLNLSDNEENFQAQSISKLGLLGSCSLRSVEIVQPRCRPRLSCSAARLAPQAHPLSEMARTSRSPATRALCVPAPRSW